MKNKNKGWGFPKPVPPPPARIRLKGGKFVDETSGISESSEGCGLCSQPNWIINWVENGHLVFETIPAGETPVTVLYRGIELNVMAEVPAYVRITVRETGDAINHVARVRFSAEKAQGEVSEMETANETQTAAGGAFRYTRLGIGCVMKAYATAVGLEYHDGWVGTPSQISAVIAEQMAEAQARALAAKARDAAVVGERAYVKFLTEAGQMDWVTGADMASSDGRGTRTESCLYLKYSCPKEVLEAAEACREAAYAAEMSR